MLNKSHIKKPIWRKFWKQNQKNGLLSEKWPDRKSKRTIEEIRKGNQKSPKIPDRRLASDFSSSGVKQRWRSSLFQRRLIKSQVKILIHCSWHTSLHVPLGEWINWARRNPWMSRWSYILTYSRLKRENSPKLWFSTEGLFVHLQCPIMNDDICTEHQTVYI